MTTPDIGSVLSLLPLLGKPFIEAQVAPEGGAAADALLPLLGKPFIEAKAQRAALAAERAIASPSGEALH